MSAGKVPVVVAYGRWDIAPWLARFRAADPARAFIVYEGPDQPLPERYYLTCWKPDPAIFRRTPAPLLISSPGAGVDHIMKADPPANVPVIRIVDADLTGRMVEYVVLHALLHLRQTCDYLASQRLARWDQRDQPAAREVTVGILGFGEMGRAAAYGLRAVGFKVAGWSRSARSADGVEPFHGAAGLGPFLAATDILVNLLPSTPQTRGLIDRRLIAGLRHPGPLGGPCFINAGRGDAVKDADLVEALTTGALRSASLDVFVEEPLPPASPFWAMDNVIVTPHVAADSMPDAVVACIMAEIGRFEAGAPLLCRVDPERGY
mgnify:CR=1 FL=1